MMSLLLPADPPSVPRYAHITPEPPGTDPGVPPPGGPQSPPPDPDDTPPPEGDPPPGEPPAGDPPADPRPVRMRRLARRLSRLAALPMSGVLARLEHGAGAQRQG
ncbi:hypothetical protein [Achromobacter aloeverae]|uniref:hypothetical protein n=1 Tax=Achromobacter aloeverae TaxID=1750518 RepID=UPI00186555A9|nr:hypothetical protein [Achromobacter aloeverae]